jgi:hypothetical protein
MKKIIYKVPGGKLLKLRVVVEGTVLNYIEIRGDFFLYPENGLTLVEKFMEGKPLDESFVSDCDQYILSEKIDIFGFSPQDIYDVLTQQNES